MSDHTSEDAPAWAAGFERRMMKRMDESERRIAAEIEALRAVFRDRLAVISVQADKLAAVQVTRLNARLSRPKPHNDADGD